jgi:hypothetical protein
LNLASKALLASTVLVVGLLIGIGATYVVTANQVSSLQKSLSDANESNMMLHDEMQNGTLSLALQVQSGQMFHSGWVFISAIGSGDYAISLHAEGLEQASAGDYIVEGVTRGATMQMVPISGNATSSEFDASATGVGNFWTSIMQNPSSSFEAIDLLYLPNMDMTHATLVASVSLG